MSRPEGQIIVLCQGDPGDDAFQYGPFDDEAWAAAWIKQHDNDIPAHTWDEAVKGSKLTKEDDDLFEEYVDDYNHYCINQQTLSGDLGQHHRIEHMVVALRVPGFDPTTFPNYQSEEVTTTRTT